MFRTVVALALACGYAAAFVAVSQPSRQTARHISVYPEIPSDRVMEGAMPPLGFWDPFGLAGMGSDETLAWFRAAELKHGRVCMAAFSGWIVQSAGIHFPGAVDLSGTTFESLGKDPIAAWAALPDGGKWQILFAIGFLEFHSELAKPHVMRGGVPGNIDTLITPGLWDPVGITKGLSEKKKAIQRTKEIANGRLAMIGMMGFFAAEAIPGSVPFVVF